MRAFSIIIYVSFEGGDTMSVKVASLHLIIEAQTRPDQFIADWYTKLMCNPELKPHAIAMETTEIPYELYLAGQ